MLAKLLCANRYRADASRFSRIIATIFPENQHPFQEHRFTTATASIAYEFVELQEHNLFSGAASNHMSAIGHHK